MPKDIASPDQLIKLLRYEPDTGKLFWLPRPAAMFATPRAAATWNTKFAGAEAFTADSGHGYLRGKIFNVDYRAHRVIWAMVTGEWPVQLIDHRNGNRSDNRLANLREASLSENQWNQGVPKRNTSGMKGVGWHPPMMKWRACIKTHGKTKHLGYFDTKEAAFAAYISANAAMHGSFGRVA